MLIFEVHWQAWGKVEETLCKLNKGERQSKKEKILDEIIKDNMIERNVERIKRDSSIYP